MPNYYIVFSPRPDDYTSLEWFIKTYVSHHITGKVLLVKEYGKKGDHPHLNLICTEKFSAANYKRTWMRRVTAELGEEYMNRNHKLISTSQTYDLDKLINGYLKKEKKWEIIYQRKMSIMDPQRVQDKKDADVLQKKINLIMQEIKEMDKDKKEPFDLKTYINNFST